MFVLVPHAFSPQNLGFGRSCYSLVGKGVGGRGGGWGGGVGVGGGWRAGGPEAQGKWAIGVRDPSRSYSLVGKGMGAGGGGEGVGGEGKGVLCEGVPSRSYAVSAPAIDILKMSMAPANRVAMLLHNGGWGGGLILHCIGPGARCTDSALNCMAMMTSFVRRHKSQICICVCVVL